LRLVCVREGLFYGDDLAERYPDGLAVLEQFVRNHPRAASDTDVFDADLRLRLSSAREFVDQVFWPAAYQTRAAVACFNFPFDISRLALHVGQPRNLRRERRFLYQGGFSLALWG